MDNITHHVAPYMAHGILALFGAVVHAAKVYREGGTKNAIDFCALVLMSSFSGVMFALLGLEWFGETSYLTMAMAGTGGFVGVEGMTWIVYYFKSKIK